MIPKGLVVAITVGVVSAAIFGLTMGKIAGNDSDSEGSSVSVVLEAKDFKKGEDIQFSIVNSGTEPITFSDTSYGVKITTLAGRQIYSPIGIPLITHLTPNEKVSFEWDQRKNDGEFVLEGRYKIQTEGFDKHNNLIHDSESLNILK